MAGETYRDHEEERVTNTKMILRSLTFVAVMGLITAACAATQDDGVAVGDESPGSAATCPEGTIDCDDTPAGGVGPPGPPGGDGQAGLLVDGGLSVSEAIAYEGTEVVAVQGFVVVRDGTARLCELLAESFPPQCGGANVVITNPEALSGAVLIEEGTTQWSENYVSVLGNINNEELTIESNVISSAAPQESNDDGVRAIQIDGVWVFAYAPGGGMDALHGGTPEIVDGCLVVDGAIVVWNSGRLDEATAAIAAVKAGERPQLLIPGGGLSLDEGTDPSQIPEAISELCAADTVWFAAP
jgi:hypothetical protein